MNSAHIHQAAQLWHTMSVPQMAPMFNVTPDCLRQNLHRYGYADPKDRRDKDRELAVKYRERFGWSTAEIAEQLDRSLSFVRKALRDVREWIQLSLWPSSDFRIGAIKKLFRRAAKAVPMHREQRDPMQLELFTA